MTAKVLRMSVPPLSNRGLAHTTSVGCTESGGGRLVGVDNPYFCFYYSYMGVKLSFGELLFVGGTALVARQYGWRKLGRGSPIVNDGGTNFRKKRLFLNVRHPEPFTFTQYWS